MVSIRLLYNHFLKTITSKAICSRLSKGLLWSGLLLACAAVPSITYGQTPLIEQYSIGKGNSKSSFNTIFQDEEGFMWFATSRGLVKFDGIKQTSFLADAEDRDVRAIAQPPNGKLWIGTSSGSIYTMEEDSFAIFKPSADFLVEAVSDLLFDKDGNLWIGSEGDGLFYYTQDRLYLLDEEEGMPDLFIYDLMLDHQGRVWACTDNGIAICSLDGTKAKIELLNRDSGLPDDIIRKAVTAPDNNVWIGTEDKGIVQWNHESQKIHQPAVSKSWTYGPVIDIDLEASQIWIASKKSGVLSYDPNREQIYVYNAKDGIKDRSVVAVKKDLEGNMWYVGKNNVYRSFSNQISFIKDFGEATMQHNIIDVTTIGDSIWFLNEDGLFLWNGDNEVITQKHLAVDANTAFISLYADLNGDLWIGTYGNGLIRYQPSTKKVERFMKELSNGNVMDITGNGHEIYLSTLGGITKITLQENRSCEFQIYNKENGLEASYTYQVFIDSQNRVWVATDGAGVLLMTGDKFKKFSKEDGIEDRTVYGITEDANANIWVNTINNGVYRYSNGKFLHFYEGYNLKDRSIQSIGSDSQGNVVLMHDGGLEVIDVHSLRTHLFDAKYGINSAYKPNLNSITKNQYKDVLIGTNQGLILFRGTPMEAELPSFPFIDGLKVLGQPVPLKGGALEFSHDQNHITIDYLGLSFLDPKGLLFSYRLDNYEREWLLSKNTSVTYSNLPPGEYVFRLKASHNQSFNTNTEVSIAFVITPPIWQRPWFVALCLTIAGLAAYTFIKNREKSLREAKLLLEQKVQERTIEIQEQNEELKVQRDQIQEQNEAIIQSSEQLEGAFKAIEKKNENITKSINYAKRIQTSILPTQLALNTAFENHFIYYLPRDVVSGDFYWFYEVGQRTYFAVVDCTGHGVPGAFMSLIGYSQLNEIVSRNPFISPANALQKLNEGVIDALRQDKIRKTAASTADGMDLALICWDRKENMLSFGLSKRPIIIAENGILHEIKGDRISIGGKRMKQGEEFTDHLFPIGDGIKVYLFSDGYPDQFGGPEGRKLGIKNVRQMLKDNHHLPMKEQLVLYRKTYLDWKGKERQIDDVIMAGIEFKANS